MSVEAELSRLVEERNSSRNLAAAGQGGGREAPGPRPSSVATVELLVTAGTPSEPVVKSGVSLPAVSWMALASSPVRGVFVGEDDDLALADGRRGP